MSLLVGINAFYGDHYLQAVLTSDLKGTLARWREAKGEERMPPQALAATNRVLFKVREQLEHPLDPAERLEVVREWWAHLLEALGYAISPTTKTFDLGTVPLLAEVRRADGRPFVWVLPVLGGGEDLPTLSRRIDPVLLALAGADPKTARPSRTSRLSRPRSCRDCPSRRPPACIA